MLRRAILPTLGLCIAAAAVATATPVAGHHFKSPAWISIEAPVNPYDASVRGAALLVHVALHDGTPAAGDLNGSAEGLVAGVRRTVPLRFDATSRPGIFAVRRQWSAEGTWLLRIGFSSTTAIVSLDRDGNVAGARIPTTLGSGIQLPRPVSGREIDSTLTFAARR